MPENSPKYGTIASFQILSNSLFINRPAIRRYNGNSDNFAVRAIPRRLKYVSTFNPYK
jgi:hypothetical protein